MFHVWDYRFSFEITPHGEILRVYHPPEENTDVLMAKKGFAALLASKLHNKENVSIFKLTVHNTYIYTVKPVYKGHSREPENGPFLK